MTSSSMLSLIRGYYFRKRSSMYRSRNRISGIFFENNFENLNISSGEKFDKCFEKIGMNFFFQS